MSLDGDVNPILVEVMRGDLVESRHRGAAIVVDAAGRTVRAWGDVERAIYPRSANKPLQAIALLESGAADRYGLSAAEIALACASHHGEPLHTAAVTGWLTRIGLDPAALECGAHAPFHQPTAAALLKQGMAPSALHNNCSGKHTGFLATAAHLGEPASGYIGYDHPVQRRVTRTVAALCDLEPERLPWATDGCGIPTLALPLRALALGMARLADPAGLAPGRAAAARRIVAAMAAHPEMIGGAASFASQVTTVTSEAAVVKSGAEGVFSAILPRQGWGIALKIEDGAPRAAELALVTILDRLGVLDPARAAALRTHRAPVLRNHAGRLVGALRPTAAFED